MSQVKLRTCTLWHSMCEVLCDWIMCHGMCDVPCGSHELRKLVLSQSLSESFKWFWILYHGMCDVPCGIDWLNEPSKCGMCDHGIVGI